MPVLQAIPLHLRVSRGLHPLPETDHRGHPRGGLRHVRGAALGGAETVNQRWRDRARLELFRWTWWNTAEVALGGAIGVLLGALWGN